MFVLLFATLISQTPIIPTQPLPISPNNYLNAGGFEQTGAWTFSGATGIGANNSPYTMLNPSAPQGTHVAYVQGGPGSAIRQTFTAPAGRYRISLQAAQRVRSAAQIDQQTVIIRVDGLEVAKLSPQSGTYALINTASFVIGAGSHLIELLGAHPQSGDHTLLLDQVRLNSIAQLARPWSSGATWPAGQVPGSGTDVQIPAGTIILLDTTAVARSVVVNGELFCADATIALSAEWVMIHGRLECGSEASPFTGKLTVTLLGVDDDEDVMGMGMGDKFLAAMGGGQLELHGEERVSWTQLAQTLVPGDTTLVLAGTTDWRDGDRLVIAPTRDSYHQGEVIELAGNSSDGRTFSFTPSIKYEHSALQTTYSNSTTTWTLDERAEVGLLSRNILIQGDDLSDSDGFGGHMMSMFGTSVHVSGIELYRMGQKEALARYPFHWHLVQHAPGQYIINSSIHRSFNRCITVHGTHDTVVADNVCYDFIGHGYFLEDGIEQNNLFDHNLGIGAKKPLEGEEILETDLRSAPASNGPAVFWIAHPDNIYTNNAAAGSEGTGFWYGMIDEVTGPSKFLPGGNINPRTSPFGIFDNNRAHSSRQGFSSCRDGSGPFGMEPPNEAWISRLTVSNVGQGVWPCAPNMKKQNARFSQMIVANTQNGMQAPNPMTFEDSVFIARSANAPLSAGPNSGLDWRAITVYDQGFLLDNVHFVNYDLPQTPVFFPGNGAHKLVNNRGLALSFDHSPNLFSDPWRRSTLGNGPADWGDVVHDLDGSFVGTNWAVVSDHPLMFDASCRQPTNLSIFGYACPHRYAHFRTENFAELGMVTVLRSDGIHDSNVHTSAARYVHEFAINGPYLYSYRYEDGMKFERVEVELYNAFPGDVPIYELLDVPATFTISSAGWSAATSLAALQSGPGSRYFWRDHSLFLKMEATGATWHAHDKVVVCMTGTCTAGPVFALDLPSVAITSPADGARFPVGTNVVVNANLSDTQGIAAARLYVGTDLWASDNSAPYSFVLSNLPSGAHALKLVAEDTAGQSFTAVQQLFIGDHEPRIEIANLSDYETHRSTALPSVSFNLSNWTVAPGGRHLHWFANGVDRGHVYNSTPIALSNLTQGRQEIRVALAEADETIRAINDQVTLYIIENHVLADFEDHLDLRGSTVPSVPIGFAWGTADPIASRLDGEDDINYFDGNSTYRLVLSPQQNWAGLYTKLELTKDSGAIEVFVIDALDGATSIGIASGAVATLTLPANPRKIDQVTAIELRHTTLTPPRTHLRNIRLVP
jgi:hypothetical protein